MFHETFHERYSQCEYNNLSMKCSINKIICCFIEKSLNFQENVTELSKYYDILPLTQSYNL